MRRRITVYGLRLSKTTFWNRINTGFSDPAVATVLTACGIETNLVADFTQPLNIVATVLTACGIETDVLVSTKSTIYDTCCNSTYRLRYWNIWTERSMRWEKIALQQHLPLAVLKLTVHNSRVIDVECCNSTYRLRYWDHSTLIPPSISSTLLQQYLPLVVCDEGGETG